ncbi:hypothetical protein QTH97_26075 [Variovorax sp. J22R24]|nr:hypothetical protein [Variovorax sp. J22R24]MDM0108443.1 hypothetical protein [Variovorax sp. J22R24]
MPRKYADSLSVKIALNAEPIRSAPHTRGLGYLRSGHQGLPDAQ